MRQALCFLALLVFASGAALAQDAAKPPAPADQPPARQQVAAPPAPKTIIVPRKSESKRFSGLTLKGQLKKPDLSYIYKRKGLRAEKIVNIPEDFNEEIVHDAGKF